MCEVTYVITLHHREVVAAHDSILEIVLGEKLSPTVVIEISAVVEEPLHGSWVLSLTWWWARVFRVGAHAVSAPDGKNGWCNLGVHGDRVIILQVLDG